MEEGWRRMVGGELEEDCRRVGGGLEEEWRVWKSAGGGLAIPTH